MNTLDLPTAETVRVPAGAADRDLVQRLFRGRRPAVLERAAADWDLMSRWSDAYLVDMLGDAACTLATDSRPALSRTTSTLRDYLAGGAQGNVFSFQDVEPGALALPRVLADVPLPNLCFAADDVASTFFYHARADGGSLPHCHMDAYNVLQRGAKRWVLHDADPDLAPAGWAALRQCHQKFGAGTHARDWFVDGPDALRAAGLVVHEFLQHPGDIVYIPEHFAHAVLNLSDTVGLVTIVVRPDKPYVTGPAGSYSPRDGGAAPPGGR